MTKANNKKKVSKVLALGCAFALVISSFAYFSDRVNTDALTVKADDNAIKIEVKDPDPVDPVIPTDPEDIGGSIEEIWAGKNEIDEKVMAPGDHADMSFVIENKGNSALDVREKLVLSSTEDMDLDNPEFRLFLDATLDAVLGGYDGGAVVVAEDIIDARHIQYTIAPYVLSGAKEVVAGEETSNTCEYHFVFDRYASNAFQGDVATIDYLVEVKQHSANGPEGGWTEVATASLTLGGQSMNVVPENN